MLTTGSAAGIELLPDKLVFVSLRKGLRGFAIKQQAVIEDYRELTPKELKAKLRLAMPSNGFSRSNLIAGLPDEHVTVRILELPLDVEENLDQVVKFQVDRFEPAEEEKSYYDYVVLSRDEAQKKLLLQVAMVRQSVLDEQLIRLRELDMYPAAVRFSGIGLHQVFAIHEDGFPKKEPSVLVCANDQTLEVLVVISSHRFFSEKLLIDPSALTATMVLDHIYRLLSRARLTETGVGKLYVAGERAAEVCAALKEQIPACELLSSRLRLKDRERASREPELLPAIGLAASGLSSSKTTRFNLIPEAKRTTGQKVSLIPTLVLLLLVVMLGLTAATREYRQRDVLLGDLESQVKKLQPQVDEVMALRSEVELREAELAEIRDLMQGNQRVLSVLRDLTERLPDDAYLQNLQIEKGQVVMFGFSDSAAALLPALRASGHFKSVQSRYIINDPVTKKEKFNFEAAFKD